MVALSSVLGAITALPSIVSGVESVIGAFGGSPASGITAAQQGALSGGFGGPVTSTGTSVGPPVIDVTGGVGQAGFGGAVIPAARAVIPRILPALGAGAIAETGARMLLGPAPPPRTQTMTRKQFILATARAFQPGATTKKIIRTARQCGIELAAGTFGISITDVCFLISTPPTRRSRGISAADVRRTRATMRKVNALKNLCPPARRRK